MRLRARNKDFKHAKGHVHTPTHTPSRLFIPHLHPIYAAGQTISETSQDLTRPDLQTGPQGIFFPVCPPPPQKNAKRPLCLLHYCVASSPFWAREQVVQLHRYLSLWGRERRRCLCCYVSPGLTHSILLRRFPWMQRGGVVGANLSRLLQLVSMPCTTCLNWRGSQCTNCCQTEKLCVMLLPISARKAHWQQMVRSIPFQQLPPCPVSPHPP